MDIRKEDLKKILEAAVRAPSGENCQPWRFVSEGDTLFVYNNPERDKSLYNFNQYGSFVSHGALIENIVIAASTFGYDALIKLFPISNDLDCTVAITFIQARAVIKNELYESIFLRASNRTQYNPAHTLEPEAEKYILDCAAALNSRGRLLLIKDQEKKKKIAQAMSYGDELLFRNPHIHHFLFEHIYWTLDEAFQKSMGFYVKELGLTPLQFFVFKILRAEPMRRFFSAIGFPLFAAKGNAVLYERSSALGAIITQGNSSLDFIEAGRLMERVWLAATRLGYDIQLVTAIPFFTQRILGNEAAEFSPWQIEKIMASYKIIARELEIQKETIALIFRVGKGKQLFHRSFRMNPAIEYRKRPYPHQ